jgi:hypothetical protein
VGEDFSDADVLTPNHFLMLNPQCGAPSSDEDSSDPDFELFHSTASDVRGLWKKGLNLLDEFWKQWSTEYLLSLRQRLSYDHKKERSVSVEPRVGHVVVIKDKHLPRGSWRLARIVELLPGSDGIVRSARVKLSRTGRIVARPVNLLCPVELTSVGPEEVSTIEHSGDEGGISETVVKRPQRAVAIKTREYLKNNQWLFDYSPFG